MSETTVERLSYLVAMKCQYEAQIAQHDKEADAKRGQLMKCLNLVTRDIEAAKAGLDIDRIKRGLEVLSIEGHYGTGIGDRPSVIHDAVDWLATGKCKSVHRSLLTERFGVKNFDGYTGQRSDHPKGYGPRHGHIVFSVGLRDPKRQLTQEEIDDAIYLLLNIEAWEKTAGLEAQR